MTITHEGLQQLIGREISSVEFVRGYVQLRFDGPCLSAFTPPTVQAPDGTTFEAEASGYADALVVLVGKTVRSAVSDSISVQLRVDGGWTATISLSDHARRAAEAALLITEDGVHWTW